MSGKAGDNPKFPGDHSKVLERAMAAANTAMKDAGRAYAAAGLDRSARVSLAEAAMSEAAKLADEAVKTAMAQAHRAMNQLTDGRKGER